MVILRLIAVMLLLTTMISLVVDPDSTIEFLVAWKAVCYALLLIILILICCDNCHMVVQCGGNSRVDVVYHD